MRMGTDPAPEQDQTPGPEYRDATPPAPSGTHPSGTHTTGNHTTGNEPSGAAQPQGRRSRGIVSVLLIVYGIFALAATARSAVQILRDFEAAPLAYSLSLFAALTYIAVTIVLATQGPRSITAIALILIELVGVLSVGTLSVLVPSLFPDATVWSGYGIGYGCVPLVLPILALLIVLRERRRGSARTTP